MQLTVSTSAGGSRPARFLRTPLAASAASRCDPAAAGPAARGDGASGPIRPLIRPDAAARAARPALRAQGEDASSSSSAPAPCSHLDTWDYKPELIKRHGQPMPGADKLVTFQGENGNLVQSPSGRSGRAGSRGKMTSDLLPHLGELADDMCFIHSMTAKSNTHGPAENQMGTGFTLEGFPSMGAWVSYALGSENQDLPAFVAIPDPRGVPQTGPNHWNSGVPARRLPGHAVQRATSRSPTSRRPQDHGRLTDGRDARLPQVPQRRAPRAATRATRELAARIASYELAGADAAQRRRGQRPVERTARRRSTLYGVDDANKHKAGFARNCLLARRLLERGVRFVQLFNGSYAMGEGVGNWDGHKRIKDAVRHPRPRSSTSPPPRCSRT